MARMPAAKWEPVTGHTDGPMSSYLGIVLHVNDANSYDLQGYFQGSPEGPGGVSSHFQVALDGTIFQYIDTAETAWCQGDGNANYLSIETEGLASEPANAAQVHSVGLILAWVHAEHGIPLHIADKPGDTGFGWHGMGAANGDPGWGHPDCPGVRKDQRAQMLAVVPQPIEDEDDMQPEFIRNTTTNAVIGHLGAGVLQPVRSGTWGTWKKLGRPVTQLPDNEWTDYTNYLAAGQAASIAAIAAAISTPAGD